MSVEFVPAVCPKCGGELRVPTNVNQIKCMYCGEDIVILNPNVVVTKDDFDPHNMTLLANSALNARNYSEAYGYFSKIIEHDPTNYDAWIGKGFAAGMLTTWEHSRKKEVEECLWVQGIAHGVKDKTSR